ncbi:uncharacterized protein KY384_001746 [Bacidia gigantensis]|uniref:uncharacterized protein n=1 Tax=Bacidia gigantensis TaxID=2732470 RepID=UPI001D04FD08|nr:uncharacterized protein KY384_001746 [Bacidia gigantensis]KAG8532964.1 hypothetical protein KY384_001746 [Bacidia gigantensis]
MSYDYISKFEPAVLPTLVPEDGYGLATRGCNSLVVSPRKSGPEMETLTWDLAKQSVLGLLEWAKERQKGGGGGGGEGEGEVVTRAPVGLYIPSYRTEKYSCVGVLRWGVKHRGEVDVRWLGKSAHDHQL